MKKSKKFLSVLLAISMILAMSVTAFAVESRFDPDPHFHTVLTEQDYTFETTDDYPYYRMWIRNFASKRILGTVKYADGTTKSFSVAAADPSCGYSDYTSSVIDPGVGVHTISVRGEGGTALNGELSVHVDATGHFRMGLPGDFIEGDETPEDLYSVLFDKDPFYHAALTEIPYEFKTTDDYPYFRLWIRNTSEREIYGTITYEGTSTPKEFTVPAADPNLGYSDYNSGIINPGSGTHYVSLRGQAGYSMSGALSIHVDSTGHFRSAEKDQ